MSCSDYSLLMLIGPLVRRLAATAPGLTIQVLAQMLWWNPRRTMDPAHAWLRARIAEIAAELDQPAPAA